MLEEVGWSDPVVIHDEAKLLAEPPDKNAISTHCRLNLQPLLLVKFNILIGAPVKCRGEFDDVAKGNNVKQPFRGCYVDDMERDLHT